MSKIVSFATACAALGMVSFGVQAFPVSSAVPQVGNPDVTLVEGGCGPGFHRGEFGRCRPNGGPVVVVPGGPVVVERPVIVERRACPFPTHLNRFGRCVP
jgi:hypothetical protein